MAQRKLTLSKVEHAASCLYPFRSDVVVPPFTTNQWAEDGNQTHAAIFSAVHGTPRPDIGEQAESYFDRWQNRYRRDDFGPAICELAVALNVITGECRVLGWNIERKYKEYGATDDEICGSIDMTCNPAGVMTIYDWKTGRQYNLSRYKNPQVRAYAAIIARIFGLDLVRAVTVVINDDGVFEYEDQLNGVWEIDQVIRSIQAMDEELTLGDPEPKPGTHCKEKYCEIAATCPALHEEARALTKQVPVPLTTKTDVARTIERLFALEAQAAAIWKAVDARVMEFGDDIELSNGKLYGQKETHRESIMATDGAREYLKSRLGEQIDEAVKVSISKESIKAAVKLVAEKRGGAKMMREIEEHLREMGVVKESVSSGLGLK